MVIDMITDPQVPDYLIDMTDHQRKSYLWELHTCDVDNDMNLIDRLRSIKNTLVVFCPPSICELFRMPILIHKSTYNDGTEKREKYFGLDGISRFIESKNVLAV